jgi:hypothetical protein
VKQSFSRPRNRWEDNIKKYLRKIDGTGSG